MLFTKKDKAGCICYKDYSLLDYMVSFYDSVVASAIFFGMDCWGSSITVTGCWGEPSQSWGGSLTKWRLYMTGEWWLNYHLCWTYRTPLQLCTAPSVRGCSILAELLLGYATSNRTPQTATTHVQNTYTHTKNC